MSMPDYDNEKEEDIASFDLKELDVSYFFAGFFNLPHPTHLENKICDDKDDESQSSPSR